MALFDALIDDLASRFGLGATAAPLTREALALIVGAEGGLDGFLNLFKRAGLDAPVAAWLGRSDPQPLTAGDLGKALGTPAIDGIAHRVGIALPAASAGLAYALPRLIGTLTPNGVVPAALPAEVMAFLAPEAAHAASEAAKAAPISDHGRAPVADHDHASGHASPVSTIRAGAAAPKWLWPLVGVGSLAALGWGVWPLLFPAAPHEAAPTQAAVPAAAPAPAAAETPSGPATLSVADVNGDGVVSGAVHDEQARGAILDALKSVFGADRIKGDVKVEANRSAAPWLASLPAALAALKIPGVSATFEGASVKVGGAIADADRERIAASLKSLLGNVATVGSNADAFAGLEAEANAKAAAALGSLKPGFSGADLVAALNQAKFGFPYGKADLPASDQGVIGAAADSLKALPPGARFEIGGYTDNAGSPGANVALSQKRADAVRDALVAAGAPSDALIARGYGGESPVASNDDEAGRFKNQRIEFHVLSTPAPAATAANSAPTAGTSASAAAPASTAPAAAAQPSTASAAAPSTAAPAPASAAQPSTLSIDGEANGVTVSGTVPDNQTHDSILAALKSVFRADAVKGDIAVDPSRAAAPWLAKLRDALAALKIPGLHAMFDGDAVTIGGAIPDRAGVVASLKSVFGDGVTVGALTDSVGDWATAANANAAEALGKLKSGFSGADVVSALNLSIVNFATDSAEVPSTVTGLLQNAANDLKALPPGYEIEVAGYTDSTGDANGNLVLSQKRAEAVRDALVKDGAPADMLTAKGYGAANPVAGNDTDEGRFRNRRIEYHIVKSPS